MKKEKEVENYPRTITCGMLFRVVEFGHETQNVHVIIDIDAGNTFYACRITKSKRDKPMLIFIHVGTASIQQLGTIVGQLSVAQMTEYFEESKQDGWPVIDNLEKKLKAYYKKGSRLLDIK